MATGEQGHGRGPRDGGGGREGDATKTPVNVPYLLACSDTEDKGRGERVEEEWAHHDTDNVLRYATMLRDCYAI